MVIKAAVIQIDCTDDRLSVITDKGLGMDETRRVLIQPDSRIQQPSIVRLCQRIGQLFVRDSRQDDPDIHTALRGILQGCFHFPVQNQIRRHDMDIVGSAVENIHVDRLPHLVLIQRTVGKGNNISFRLLRFYRGLHFRRKLQLLPVALVGIPKLQKHQRKAFRSLALQHHSGILPVPEADNTVDVLIGKIDPACKSGFSVDHHNLAVIPVIIMRGDHGTDRRKTLGMNALFLHQFPVSVGKIEQLAHAVIHHTDVNACLRLADQHIQNAAPHISFLYDVILHKDICCCFFKLLQ